MYAEEQAVELFARNIAKAGNYFLENPMETPPFIASWNRVIGTLPDLLDHFSAAVEADHDDVESA